MYIIERKLTYYLRRGFLFSGGYKQHQVLVGSPMRSEEELCGEGGVPSPLPPHPTPTLQMEMQEGETRPFLQ